MDRTEIHNEEIRIVTPEGWLDKNTSPELAEQFDLVIADGGLKGWL